MITVIGNIIRNEKVKLEIGAKKLILVCTSEDNKGPVLSYEIHVDNKLKSRFFNKSYKEVEEIFREYY